MTRPFVQSLAVLSVAALSCVLRVDSYYSSSPIVLCLKNDFSVCANVTYPTACVNLNEATINGTGQDANHGACTVKLNALQTVESVVVWDVDSYETRCVALFDGYNCQGRMLLLNGTTWLSADLHDYGFASTAVSMRSCTDNLVAWIQSQPVHQKRVGGPVTSYEGVPASASK